MKLSKESSSGLSVWDIMLIKQTPWSNRQTFQLVPKSVECVSDKCIHFLVAQGMTYRYTLIYHKARIKVDRSIN